MPLIPPIGATPASVAPAPTQAATRGDAAGAAARGDSFSDSVGKALDNLQATQTKADSMAQDAATGRLQNIEDYLITASEAQLATQLTVAVRNRAVEAFNEIMRMQV